MPELSRRSLGPAPGPSATRTGSHPRSWKPNLVSFSVFPRAPPLDPQMRSVSPIRSTRRRQGPTKHRRAGATVKRRFGEANVSSMRRMLARGKQPPSNTHRPHPFKTLKLRASLRRDRMPSDEDEMLREMGLRSVDDLFADIPSAVRISKLDIPDGLPEDRVVARVTSMLAANRTVVDMPTFLGGGLYDHFVPASVRAVVSRSEFYTSYTPYQPEISQGLLQALWEYQSLICELTGMDAANTSMYDGSTALGEAARMAHRIHGGRIFLIPRALRHNRRAVLANYVVGAGLEVREV